MTNFEYYKNEIMEIVDRDKSLAVIDGKPGDCLAISCVNCDLDDRYCEIEFIKWLYSEHRPLTEEDMAMCHAVDPDTYIYRGGSGNLYLSSSENAKNLDSAEEDTVTFFDNAIKIDSRMFDCVDIGKLVKVSELLSKVREENV